MYPTQNSGVTCIRQEKSRNGMSESSVSVNAAVFRISKVDSKNYFFQRS